PQRGAVRPASAGGLLRPARRRERARHPRHPGRGVPGDRQDHRPGAPARLRVRPRRARRTRERDRRRTSPVLAAGHADGGVMFLRLALACWAAAALLLAGCGGSDEPRKAPAPQPLTVATGGQGGIYAEWGAAYARAITKQLDGYRGVAALTTGSVENLERLRDGRAQIALTLGDTALDA